MFKANSDSAVEIRTHQNRKCFKKIFSCTILVTLCELDPQFPVLIQQGGTRCVALAHLLQASTCGSSTLKESDHSLLTSEINKAFLKEPRELLLTGYCLFFSVSCVGKSANQEFQRYLKQPVQDQQPCQVQSHLNNLSSSF